MRVVLDTNVMVAAQRSGAGVSAMLVEAVRHGRLTALVSTALWFEYEAVLTREEHLQPRSLSQEDALLALKAFADVAEPVEIHFRWRQFASDPDDDMVLEAAINGRAEAIVTSERSTFEGAKRFGIAVMTPKQAWSMIGA